MFRDFTSDTRFCRAVHRHGKILQGTHVLHPAPSPPGLRTPFYIFLNRVFMIFRFINWKKYQTKTVLEPCCNRHYKVQLTINTAAKL